MVNTSQTSSLRKPATAAARGVVLAVHATAGLADSVDREAARLLRASEGLARAALALLEASARQKADPPSTNAARQRSEAPVGAGTDAARQRSEAADSTEEPGGGKKGAKVKPKEKNKKKNKDNKAKKKKAMDSMMNVDGKGELEEEEEAKVTSIPGGEMVIDDFWADLKAQHFPKSVPDRVDSPLATTPEAKRRAIAVQVEPKTGTESVNTPRRSLGYKGTVLKAGEDATLTGLVSRPELNCAAVTLLEFVEETNRWTCRVWHKAGGKVCILPINLHGFLKKNEKEDRARRNVATACKQSFDGEGNYRDEQS